MRRWKATGVFITCAPTTSIRCGCASFNSLSDACSPKISPWTPCLASHSCTNVCARGVFLRNHTPEFIMHG